MAPLGPFGPAPRLAAGVSGGPHSLALALLARDFARDRGGDLLALIADHGLRPESAAEAAWTLDRLSRLGIPGRVIALNLPGGAAVQERARAARLDALLRACAAEGRPWLLLGQHRMDQAETVLFRALRGSGPAGLSGMASWRAAPQAVILRPLLGIPPARLEAVLRDRDVAPLRDPSNRDARFTRVRLRQALADPDGAGAGVAALAGAAQGFARRRAVLEAEAAARLTACAALRPEGWAHLEPGPLGDDAVALAALAALLRVVSGAEHAPSGAALRGLLRQGRGTLHGVMWEGGVLCREPAACAPPVPARPGARWDGRWRLGRGAVPEGALWGALGAAAVPRAARRGLPARVLAGLPALWLDGDLLRIPALEPPPAPDADGAAPPDALFDPLGGPLFG